MKRYYYFGMMLMLLLALGTAGCGAGADIAPTEAPPATAQPQEVDEGEPPVTEPPAMATPEPQGGPAAQPGAQVPVEAQGVARLARQDLAGRQGVTFEGVRVVSVDAVEWPDTSLGCPQPGVMYAQVVTPGYRMVLQAGEQRYEYHAGREDQVVLCQPEGESQAPRAPAGPSAQPLADSPGAEVPAQAQGAVSLAVQDLAGRQGLAPEAVRVASVEAVEWSDASLGCPQPGMMYAQVITPGYRVVLEAEGQTYEYHTDEGRFVVLCDNGPSSGAEPSRGAEFAVQDGWPNQTRDGDVVLRPTQGRK